MLYGAASAEKKPQHQVEKRLLFREEVEVQGHFGNRHWESMEKFLKKKKKKKKILLFREEVEVQGHFGNGEGLEIAT